MDTLAAEPPARRGDRRLTPGRRDALVLAGLFLAAALISGFTMLRAVDPFDEGLMLQAARRVADGQVPYRDFLWSYGPAQPYLLGGLSKLFGVSLLDWRVLRVLADAGVALVVFVIARREAGPRLATVGWLAAACAMAQPRSANPFPLALLAALGALAVATSGPPSRRRVILAALLTAAAAAFRLDFAIYAGAAVAAGFAVGRHWRPAAVYAAATAGLTLLVYLPFLIATGPADLYDALVGTSLRDKDHWTLPFPVDYPGGLNGLRDVKDVIDFYLPVALVAGLAVGAFAVLVRAVRERSLPPSWAALLVFGAGCLAYLLSRTDEFHAAPLLVLLAILLPIVIARSGPRWIAGAAAVALVFLLVQGAWNRASALLRPPAMEPIHVAVADGVEAPPAEARAIERMVAAVQRRVPPGDPIYVVSRRSDLVRFNSPLVYVLTERDNPTPRDFGLETGAAAQAQIVATLRRVRPRAVVRWTDPISTEREPNLRGRPSGVRTLDDFLALRYRLAERDGVYDVLVPR
jgi:hypothetical protein